MADTLAEIHSSSVLQESDFNSSGEATLLTTNSSTKHVIKDVHIIEGDSNFKVQPFLNIGGFDTVQLTGNASGSEIVGPSSTVKLKTSTFPLQYVDHSFITQTATSQYSQIVFPRVNGQEGYTTTVNQSAQAIGHTQFTPNNSTRALYLGLGPNNYQMLIDTDINSATRLYLRQADGTLVQGYTDNYMPWWFDDTQYAYRYNWSTNVIQRLDCFTGTLTTLKAFNDGNSGSTYAKMFGVNNADGTTAYLYFWTSENNYAYYYDFANDKVAAYTSVAAQTAYHNMNTFWNALMKTNGEILHFMANNTSRMYVYDWSPDTVYDSGKKNSYEELNWANNQQFLITGNAFRQVVGSRMYYLADSTSYTANTLAYLDFDQSGDSRFKTTDQVMSGVSSYGYGVSLSKVTPSNSTVSGRTYNITPSFKVRLTGVTST